MTITYTKDWSQPFSESQDGREITLSLHVVSDADNITPHNYTTATELTSGEAFPAIGQILVENPRYRLLARSAPQYEGPRYVVVACKYSTAPTGGSQETEDPLSNPVRYSFRPATNNEPTNYDANGNPLINSAGGAFPPVNGFFNSYIIEATRNESAFNAPIAVSYHNKLNSGAVSIGGTSFNPGEVLCTGIFPDGEYRLTDEYVPITYQFEVRDRLTLDNGSRLTAFVYRILDQGREAYIYDGSKVPIYHRNGEVPNPTPASSDVLLDEGAPAGEPDAQGKDWWSVDPSFNPPDYGWEKNNQIDANILLAKERIERNGNPPITWLYYRKYKETDFSGLGL